jgi:hypothetical protein
MKRWLLFSLLAVAPLGAACLWVGPGFVEELDRVLQQIECSSRDERAHCTCRSKCISEESDCHCED